MGAIFEPMKKKDWEFVVAKKILQEQKPDYETFAKRLAEARKAAGYSQRSLAQEIGISQRMLAYYETHAIKPPFEILPLLAQALNVSERFLLGKEKPPKKKNPPTNRRLLAKLRKIEQLPKRDQQALMRTIDAFLDRP